MLMFESTAPGAPSNGHERFRPPVREVRHLARDLSITGAVARRPCAEVNGQAGAIITDPDGGLISVWSLGVAGDRIQSVRSVVNPNKLAHLGPVSGLKAMFERARGRRTSDLT